MSSSSPLPILVNGDWVAASSETTFQATDPSTSEKLDQQIPRSNWDDCQRVLAGAEAACDELVDLPSSTIAAFLNAYADRLEGNAAAICEVAHRETGLPLHPRLMDVEMPRTVDQLRQAAAAATEITWRRPVKDPERNIYSCLGSIGPVVVFGPNNFPLAFNAIAGGDFAAAIAAGNPVIAKAHPDHPQTTYLLATEAAAAAKASGVPAALVQMIYDIEPADGLRFVADPRVGAVAFTGSRAGGMKLKSAADAVGKPIYLEMSSINPVFVLPDALDRKDIAEEVAGSCLIGSGQFCTCPNLIVVQQCEQSDAFIAEMRSRFANQAEMQLLTGRMIDGIKAGLKTLQENGAKMLVGGKQSSGPAFAFESTLLQVKADEFLAAPETLQTEVFGPASMIVVCDGEAELLSVAKAIEGSLTATIMGSDENSTATLISILRRKAGRILHNKMPTGVAVSPAMNHGGPFPATGHPRFTAVGIPTSLERFAKLDCYDNVPAQFLPNYLKDES